MEYELVREIQNQCPNNQMRDIFFTEVETDDPTQYVRNFLGEEPEELTVDPGEKGTVTIFATCNGLRQKFIFTPI